MRLDLLEDEDLPVDFGRYRVLRVLGEGGMARVFEAQLGGAEGFRKAVALKVVRGAETRRDPALRRALVREARLGGLLRHPGIVDTYDFGEHDGQVYIAMELVRGQGLDELLRDRGRLPAGVVVAIAIKIVDALDHAHTATDAGEPLHLVHRDLKPSNILVGHDGTVKVADFGIAKAATIAGDTRTGETKGTPLYMSPEQLEGARLDGRSDLFALGAMLWEMALGERLHRADSLPALVLATLQVDERLGRPGALTPLERVAPGLGAVVGGCLRRSRQERYADARSVLRDLMTIAARLPPVDLRAWLGGGAMGGLGGVPAQAAVRAPLADTVDTAPPPAARGGPGAPSPRVEGAIAAPESVLVDTRPGFDVGPQRPTRPLLLPVLAVLTVAVLLLAGALWLREGPAEFASLAPGVAPAAMVVDDFSLDAGGDDPDGVAALIPPPDGFAAVLPGPGALPTPRRDARTLPPGREPATPVESGLVEPAATPAPAATPTATPVATPAATPAPPQPSPTPELAPLLAITSADYDQLPVRGQKIRVRFTAETRCPSGCTLRLITSDLRGDRQTVDMTAAGSAWAAEVVYPASSSGHIKWWITAKDAEGNVARYGNEARPKDAVVR